MATQQFWLGRKAVILVTVPDWRLERPLGVSPGLLLTGKSTFSLKTCLVKKSKVKL